MAWQKYPNGFIIYCSEELFEVVHPPQPVLCRECVCDVSFDTALLHVYIEGTFSHGVVVIDGKGASVGIATSNNFQEVQTLQHIRARISSRTRRGGQSASRFSRIRDADELAFLRKVRDHVVELLGNARSLIVGGSAELKHKLIDELPGVFRARVVKIVELNCGAGHCGLRKAGGFVEEASHAAQRARTDQLVGRFLALAATPCAPSMCCYGESQTASAVKMGAVEWLLVARSSKDGEDPSLAEWRECANIHGSMTVEVGHETELEQRFSRGFRIGAILRWAVDEEFFDEADEHILNASCRQNLLMGDHLPMADGGSNGDTDSTVDTPRQDHFELFTWLRQALLAALGLNQVAVVEAHVACAEVLLLVDDSAALEERVIQTVEVLRSEGVPETVLEEFSANAYAHLSRA